ncbi:MAG: CBS domain-containing protein, partial [Cyanobium sp.]
VGDVMSRRTHTCGVDLPLPAAARQLHEGGTQRLFVLDGDGKLAGVLSRGDVVRAPAAAEGSGGPPGAAIERAAIEQGAGSGPTHPPFAEPVL